MAIGKIVTVGGTAPTIEADKMLVPGSIATHTFTDTTGWTLTAAEADCGQIEFLGTPGGAFSCTIALARAAARKTYICLNRTPSNATVKVSGETGCAVLAGNSTIIQGTGTDFETLFKIDMALDE